MTETTVLTISDQVNELQVDVKHAIKTLAREQEIIVKFRGVVTRVKLKDGTTGKAKYNPEDTYSALIGYQVALARATARAALKQAVILKHKKLPRVPINVSN